MDRRESMTVGEGGPVACYLVEPTDRCIRSLRRFRFSTADGGRCEQTRTGIHDASVTVGEVAASAEMIREGWNGDSRGRERGPDDPPFPDRCVCGVEFTADDEWQVNLERIYADTGDATRRWPMRDMPPGAMWDAQWARAFGTGPDGRALTVRLPCGHDWHIDGPAGNAPAGQRGWNRTGEPPLISATPSILCKARPVYHGFLGSNGQPPGVLSPHIG